MDLQLYQRQAAAHFTAESFANFMDSIDPLQHFRDKFHYPIMKHCPKVDLTVVNPNDEVIYFSGNSLGLQPKAVSKYVNEQLCTWAHMGVYGHRYGAMPWAFCDEQLQTDCAQLVGVHEKAEVALMNSLTINLHLLLFAFYKPEGQRKRILLEKQTFPSDYYAFESHARLHGFEPADILYILQPREGEACLRHEDIVHVIQTQGDSLAVICLSGLNYYTGQLFQMEEITRLGHERGCLVGWDLAHAIGNVPLQLHDWQVDFACWCTYKYLNSGAGGIAGIFVHEKHHHRQEENGRNFAPTLQGWWGHRIETRFDMTNCMELASGAAGFRVSTPPILLCCALRGSLDVFNEVPGGMETVRSKSILLTDYLDQLLRHYFCPHLMDIITPSNIAERGAQLSLKFVQSQCVDEIFAKLESRGVACDVRRPDVIRIAPVPLYNSFHDVWRFVTVLREIIM